jgi:protein SCO1/2
MKTSLLFPAVALAAAGAAYWAGAYFSTSPASDRSDCCAAPAVAAAPVVAGSGPAPMAHAVMAAMAAPSAPLPVAAPASADAPLPPKSLYHLDATWQDDTGAKRLLASLRGEPVVLAMIFTNCEYACPIIVTDLLRIRAALPEALRDRTRFVLVSFDAARDTPPVLRAYRSKMRLDDPAWTLLHGDAADVQELAMLLGVKYKQDTKGNFSHSNTITVLNPGGEIAFQREGLRGDTTEAVRAVAATLK